VKTASFPTALFGARGAAVVALISLVAVFLSWSVTSAIGHNVVVSTTPEAGSTVSDSPIDIRIVTNDQLLDLGGTGSGFAIVVRDAEGLYYGNGCVAIGDTEMSATAALGNSGDYTVTFQFVSADGHSLSDSFDFSFDPLSTHVPTAGFEQAPQCGVEQIMPITEGDETTATDMQPVPEGTLAEPVDEVILLDEEPERGVVTLAIAAVLVVLSITLLVWMVRRRNGS
jgi:methionine-rich copper-binding protein CopC